MQYEYRVELFDYFAEKDIQDLFDNGWEYVHGFSQSVSTASNYTTTKEGKILIIFRKQKLSL